MIICSLMELAPKCTYLSKLWNNYVFLIICKRLLMVIKTAYDDDFLHTW